jgi:hypothetical protein
MFSGGYHMTPLEGEKQSFTVNFTSCSVAHIFKLHTVIMSLLILQILVEENLHHLIAGPFSP